MYYHLIIFHSSFNVVECYSIFKTNYTSNTFNQCPYIFFSNTYCTQFQQIYMLQYYCYLEMQYKKGRRGGLVVQRRIPEREVGGSILTQVALLYTFTSKKVLVIHRKRWLHPDMNENY